MINLSFFKKPRVGINISSDFISIVKLEKNGSEYQIKDFNISNIKGFLKPSLTEANIINTEAFKKTIVGLIGGKKTYASISIPNISVKTTLLEFESLPQKKGEIERLIKWKVEKSIPFSVDEARLSYQILGKREGEKSKILAAIIKKAVLIQYEEVLKESSIEPMLIDSSSFRIFNLYHDFIMKNSSNQNFIFLDLRDNMLAIMIFKKSAPDLIRIKPIKANSITKRVKDELIASLKFYSHSNDISDMAYLYYFTDTNIVANELIEDMKIKRLGIEQVPWLNPFFINPPVSPFFKGGAKEFPPLLKGGEGGLLNFLPAIGAAMEE